jgi:tripartite-type tricarboxylate transporter receptor subunit TctC
MASGGAANAQHVYGEMFKSMAGVDMLHVPYRGGGPALIDLLAGHVPVMFDNRGTSVEHIRGGKLRAVAVTSATRSDVLPKVPAVAEFVSGYDATNWIGIGAPRNTPVEIIDKLNKEINLILVDPKIKSRLVDMGGTVLTLSPTEYGKLLAGEVEKWRKVAKFAGLKAE